MDSGYHVVSTSVANESQAVELARRIVENRLTRCVQIIPKIRSIYQWDGEFCDDDEYLLLIKLPEFNLEHLLRLLPRWHPYEVPEIVSVPISAGHPPYLKWLDEWRYKDSP